jgi:hypothetical protein
VLDWVCTLFSLWLFTFVPVLTVQSECFDIFFVLIFFPFLVW